MKESTIKRIGRVVVFGIAESHQKTVCNKFDVLFHEFGVDSKEWARERLCQESLFNPDCFGDDVLNRLLAGSFT